jgi:hypothetical protein
MCAVSMIFDHYGKQTSPFIVPPQPAPWSPNTPNPLPQPFQWQKVAPAQGHQWDAESLRLLREAIEIIKKLDAKLGLADCDDPKKAAWLAEVERKVAIAQHDDWGRLKK